MGEFAHRGYSVTLFCPSSPKYRAVVEQWGLGDAVRIVGYESPSPDFKEVLRQHGVWSVLSVGGPLAVLSQCLFPAILADYAEKTPPLALISDFFASSALDAGDILGIPTIGLYPNPIGMTSLRAPHLRTWRDTPTIWLSRIAEGILARVLRMFRNRERSQREPKYRLPPLVEQDIYPCLSMRRPILACTALGFEYAYPQSPLLQFMGPSPPCNALSRDARADAPDLFEWLDQQDAVIYVAFGTMHTFTDESVNVLYEQLSRVTSATHALRGKRVSVLWSLPAAQQALLRSTSEDHSAANIRLETFVPQWDVLAFSKVVVFVSHCGANSLYEALLNGVPIVCCPGKADQPANAARVESTNAGVLSTQGIYTVQSSLLGIFSSVDFYSENAAKVRDIFQCQGGAITGADFVEQLISCGTHRLTPHESCSDRYSWSRMFACFVLAAVASSTAMFF